VILDEEVLPAEEHPVRRRRGDRVPGGLLRPGGALPVHVDDDREVVVAGVKVPLAPDHCELELVHDEKLLRQAVPGGQRREPADDAVDLTDVHVPDLPQRSLPGLQLPLRVQGEADFGQFKERLVVLGLLEEARAPGLEVEHHVQAVGDGPVHPGQQLRGGRLIGVGPVRTR
jgi:hypothetical protein